MTDIQLPVCVRLTRSGEVILRADRPDQVVRLEGNWYFHPSLVNRERFVVTDRLYTCPYKGTCNWVDYELGKLYLPDVSWVYPQTLPGYKHIAGWFGFYPSTIHYKTGDCEA